MNKQIEPTPVAGHTPTLYDLAEAYNNAPCLARENAALRKALEKLTRSASKCDNAQHAGIGVPADYWSDLFSCINSANAALALVGKEDGK